MTNKEAIEFIKTDISRLWDTPQNLEHKEALEMAIKALEQEPCKEEKRMITIDMEMPRCCIGCPIMRDIYGQEAYCPFVCEENNINIKQRTDRPNECPLKETEKKE